MIPSLISLAISPYTPWGVYFEIYPSLGGNIERVKSQYSIFYNYILSVLGLNLGYTVKYTPSPLEFPWASPSGTP